MVAIRVTNGVLAILTAIWWLLNRHNDMAEPIAAVVAAVVLLEEVLAEFAIPAVARHWEKQAKEWAEASVSALKRIEKEERNISQVVEGKRKGDKVIEVFPLDLLEPEMRRLAAFSRTTKLTTGILAEIQRNRTLESGKKQFDQLAVLLSEIKELLSGEYPIGVNATIQWALAAVVMTLACIGALNVRLPESADRPTAPPTSAPKMGDDDDALPKTRDADTSAHSDSEPNTAKQTGAASLFDLSAGAVPLLRQLPNVVKVERHGPATLPTHRIIHIADWHFVPKDDFAADLRSQSSEPISDEAIDRQYAEHLDEVEAIQSEQIEFLRTLIQKHGLKRIHIEGLAEKEEFIFDAKVSALRKVGLELVELRNEKKQFLALGDPDDDTRKIIDGIEEIEAQHRSDLLHLGAAGRLLLSGEIEAVLPLENAAAHAASNPVSDDGSVALDQEKIEAREDAQARLLLDGEPVAIIILGGAHDLSGNVERLSGGKAEYIRLEVKAWKQIGWEDK